MKKYALQRRDAAQIAYHWTNFAAIAVLAGTGLAIFFGSDGTVGLFAWHLWAAWVLIAALIFHVWYSLVPPKRLDRMLVDRSELRASADRLRGASQQDAKHGHYKVEQIVFHWFIALVVIGLIVTGFILWKPSRLYLGVFWLPWGWDGVYVARIVHDFCTFVLLAAVVAHVYFALCVPKNRPYLRSMFSGRVSLDEYARDHRLSPQVQAQLESGSPERRQAVKPAN